MSFHTQANLTQTLESIILAHHKGVQTGKENSGNLPAFAAEAMHQICFNLAAIADNDALNVQYWENMGILSREVVAILRDKQTQQLKGNKDETASI